MGIERMLRQPSHVAPGAAQVSGVIAAGNDTLVNIRVGDHSPALPAARCGGIAAEALIP